MKRAGAGVFSGGLRTERSDESLSDDNMSVCCKFQSDLERNARLLKKTSFPLCGSHLSQSYDLGLAQIQGLADHGGGSPWLQGNALH
uniref:Uncharacterized protein n=1 Tax=Saccharum spontaneum TaxID=62335 RepID=A0A678THV5_SACSP|nr:hypothetical protein SS80F19_000010 [Saccharum spontaneum]